MLFVFAQVMEHLPPTATIDLREAVREVIAIGPSSLQGSPFLVAIGGIADIGWPAAGWTRFAVDTVITVNRHFIDLSCFK